MMTTHQTKERGTRKENLPKPEKGDQRLLGTKEMKRGPDVTNMHPCSPETMQKNGDTATKPVPRTRTAGNGTNS